MRYYFHCFFCAILLLNLTGCRHAYQCFHKEFTQTYCPLPNDLPDFEPRPEVILVLGGGGAKGMAHIGILEEFEKAGIPIDLIVGCSAGSLVGSLYSICPDSAVLKKILEPIKRKDFIEMDFTAMRFGLSRGDPLKRFLLRNLGDIEFHETKIPLIIVATDLNSAELVQISTGPIAPAVQASCAYPFIFAPVRAYGRTLVDGGVIDPVPVGIARYYQPKMVIAIDLCDIDTSIEPDNLFNIAKRCTEIRFHQHGQCCSMDADIVVHPDLLAVGIFQEGANLMVYEAGKKAAQEAIPRILKVMESKGIMQVGYNNCTTENTGN